jgi:hypothetical protein
MRANIPSCLLMVFLLASCAQDKDWDPAVEGGGSGASGGTTSTGAGSTTSTGGTTTSGTNGGAWTNVGGTDNGGLFGPNAVPYDPASAGGTGGTGTGGTGGMEGPPGDGNVATSTIKGDVDGTATFTQTGIDVTVVIELTKCPDGDLVITIHDGYACDNESTEGEPWDGSRGEIGTVACSGNSGSLTVTRPGSDTATNRTVADHNLDTDLSAHVLIVTKPAEPDTRIACGNFF